MRAACEHSGNRSPSGVHRVTSKEMGMALQTTNNITNIIRERCICHQGSLSMHVIRRLHPRCWCLDCMTGRTEPEMVMIGWRSCFRILTGMICPQVPLGPGFPRTLSSLCLEVPHRWCHISAGLLRDLTGRAFCPGNRWNVASYPYRRSQGPLLVRARSRCMKSIRATSRTPCPRSLHPTLATTLEVWRELRRLVGSRESRKPFYAYAEWEDGRG